MGGVSTSGLRYAVAGLALVVTAGACAPPAPGPAEWSPLPEPDPGEVDAVLFLVGDAGAAVPGRSPVLGRLGDEVERWSARLEGPADVAVAYLGDIVYPWGVRPRGSGHFHEDSLRLRSQVEVVAGPEARRLGASVLFLAGNHDWGQMAGDEGVVRLRNLEALIDEIAATEDLPLELVPRAGAPGPHVRDLGGTLRVVSVDTHWWLQAHDDAREDSVVLSIAESIEEAGDREVVMLSHHPYVSAGPHGAPMPIWRGLGLLYLLRRSGALIQDINSEPYTDLRLSLAGVFAESGRPLAWAGGHDHSLQVIAGMGEGDPEWNLVSGSGSKLTGVSDAPGMSFGASRPGFMRLTALKDGSVLLHVYAAPERFLLCKRPADPEPCMTEGVPAFEVVFADRLR